LASAVVQVKETPTLDANKQVITYELMPTHLSMTIPNASNAVRLAETGEEE
jgi:hypothetical protein